MNEQSAFFGVLPDNAIVVSNTVLRYEFSLDSAFFYLFLFQSIYQENSLFASMNCGLNYSQFDGNHYLCARNIEF